jgi:hypothetical protein
MFNKLLIVPLSLFAISVAAQESPAPTPTPTPSATATPASARSVRISFLPPPMEGTISLGIYDCENKLVRVLVDQGEVDEFEVGADALIVKWDGKNDHDEDLPAGKYHARGWLVGRLKVEDVGKAEAIDPNATDHVQVKLVANPLAKDAKLLVDLAVAFENEHIVLKTSDGLPLFDVIETPQSVRIAMAKSGDKSIDVWADNGSAIEQIRVSNIDKMMAFDAGELELK